MYVMPPEVAAPSTVECPIISNATMTVQRTVPSPLHYGSEMLFAYKAA
jgi:hypothetical protein